MHSFAAWESLPLSGLAELALVSTRSDEPPALHSWSQLLVGYSESRSADWRAVRKLGIELATQRRDLKLLAVLALAVFCVEAQEPEHGRPYLWLGAALRELHILIAGGWSACWPRSPTARENLFSWLAAELAVRIESHPPMVQELDAARACHLEAEALGRELGSAQGVDYVLFKAARSALEVAVPTVDAVPAAAGDERPSTASVGDPPASATAEPEEGGAAAAALQLGRLVAQVSQILRSEAIADPAPYWMVRALHFATHDLLQPQRLQEVIANGYRTTLPLPIELPTLLAQAPGWLTTGAPSRVIEECEELLSRCPLALDLHQLVFEALGAIGALAAQQVIAAELRLLLSRCPELVDCYFADFASTPLASAATQRWLASLADGARLVASPSSAVAAVTESVAIPPELETAMDEHEAQLASSVHGEQRFELELRLLATLLAHQQLGVAQPLAQRLLEQAAHHDLAAWRPDLLGRALELGIAANRDRTFEQQSLWAELCRLSPAQALRKHASVPRLPTVDRSALSSP